MQLSRGLRLASVVIVPAAALYIGLARPIIVALLQRGAFSGGDASVVADTLVAFSVGLLPFSLYLFAMRAFYARHDTFTPFWLNCIENAINIGLAFPLYAWLGIPGLALAFSLAYFVAALLTLFVLHLQLGGIDDPAPGDHPREGGRRRRRGGGGELGRRRAHRVVDTTTAAFVSAIIGTLVGGAVYLGGLALLHVDELSSIAALVPARRRPGGVGRRPRV